MMKEIVFDSLHVKSIGELHRELARSLDFPGHYGMNLDALYDCLSGEIALPLRIIWRNYHVTRLKVGKDAVKVLKVMKDFAKEDPRFTVEVD
jgi:ribonuclease inhibitor